MSVKLADNLKFLYTCIHLRINNNQCGTKLTFTDWNNLCSLCTNSHEKNIDSSLLIVLYRVLMLYEWKDNINNSATKNKRNLFLCWELKCRRVYSVSSHDCKCQFWCSVDKIFIQIEIVTWQRCLKIKRTRRRWENSTYHSGLVWVTDLCCLEYFMASRWIPRARVDFRKFFGRVF